MIIEVNGKPVSTQAQAYSHGKRLWKQGVRTFRAKVRTRYGRIEERSVTVPDN